MGYEHDDTNIACDILLTLVNTLGKDNPNAARLLSHLRTCPEVVNLRAEDLVKPGPPRPKPDSGNNSGGNEGGGGGGGGAPPNSPQPALVDAELPKPEMTPVQVVQLMNQKPQDPRVIRAGAAALQVIAVSDGSQGDTCVAAGAIPILLNAIQNHPDNPGICEFSINALAYIAKDKDVHRDACVTANAIPIIVTTMEHNTQHPPVLEAGGLALQNIARNSDARRSLCIKAIPILVRALRDNTANPDVCGRAGGALLQVVMNSPAHRAAVVNAGAVAPLVAAFQAHPELGDIHEVLQKLGFNDDGTPLGGGGGAGGRGGAGGAGGRGRGGGGGRGRGGGGGRGRGGGPGNLRILAAKAGRQGGGARSNDEYIPISIKSLIQQQSIWEDANHLFNTLHAEFKAILPKPGPPPVLEILNPIIYFLTKHANQDKLEEARAAIGLLSPEDLDMLMNPNDYSSSITQRIHGLYEKALPQARLFWIPTIVRADILSEFFKAT